MAEVVSHVRDQVGGGVNKVIKVVSTHADKLIIEFIGTYYLVLTVGMVKAISAPNQGAAGERLPKHNKKPTVGLLSPYVSRTSPPSFLLPNPFSYHLVDVSVKQPLSGALAIGSALMVHVFAGGHISGAHCLLSFFRLPNFYL